MRKKSFYSILSQIRKPTIILNKDRVLRNIEKMAEKARESGVFFRPHFKTHQSSKIGEWFREFGVIGITVSSVSMAHYFYKNGWKDITIAFPVNIREIDSITELSSKISLNLLVLSRDVVKFLNRALEKRVNVWIKIDVGTRRTGIPWDNFDSILELAKEIENSEKLNLEGILTHAGHSYRCKSKEEILEVYKDSVIKMNKVKEILENNLSGKIKISVGDTPTCSLVDRFEGVDEVRPGNFVFYDVMQLELNSCNEDDIAITVACPVVAKHPERKEIIIYGGAVHLSKDFILSEEGTKVFGYVAFPEEKGWGPIITNSYVSSLSQEHGILKIEENYFEKIKVGDIIMVLPVHSCLTVDALKRYMTLEGEVIECGFFKS